MLKQSIKRKLQSALSRRQKVLAATMVNLGRPRHVDVLKTEDTNDYIRLAQLDLAIHEILEQNVLGDMAEVGVYKGSFSAVLNGALPDRDLFLFDTFEGFAAEQVEFDRQNFGMSTKKNFTDTGAAFVLSKMPHPEKCIVRKGFFPATSVGLEDRRFCFVSLDTDLYEPILAGLDFFYDRLSPGGFIFVHDYNYVTFPGAKRAVLDFCQRRKVTFIPVTDSCGTAIFRV